MRRVGLRTIVESRTRIPETYAYFEGHFPTYPVLAGAVQLHELILPCLRRARPGAGPPIGLAGVKFPKRILPGDTLVVRLVLQDGSREVEFEIDRDEECCTRGRLSLAPGAAEGAA